VVCHALHTGTAKKGYSCKIVLRKVYLLKYFRVKVIFVQIASRFRLFKMAAAEPLCLSPTHHMERQIGN
jgi:hypothetical protein